MKINTATQSILIIGASGRTGLECIAQLTEHKSEPPVHAFCRDASKIPDEYRNKCSSIQLGNARESADIEQALKRTGANIVIVSIGNGDNVAKTDIRTASAQALVHVLNKDKFKHVCTVVISSSGASTSRIMVGFGMGQLISFYLRYILEDHTGQEDAFRPVGNRTLIVRPTSLTENQATGNIVEFGDCDKCPTLKTDRSDLVAWIGTQLFEADPFGEPCKQSARAVNLTSI